MKKKVISTILVIVLLVTFIMVKPLAFDSPVNAKEYRNGYALTPQKQDSTGIDESTTFIFESETELTLERVQAGLKVSPEVELKIEQIEEGFLITPVTKLLSNKIYVFSFEGINWTFQTRSLFQVLGTLPGNETANVPVQTGIEMYFSHPGAQVEDYFSIEPAVKGSFETHGNTVVFVPDELEERTIYTVTLKKGLKLKDSEQTLLEDYVFSFETALEDESYYDAYHKGFFSFRNLLNDFSTKEVPAIPMDYYIYDDKYDDFIQVDVYSYSNVDSFIGDLKKLYELPPWTIFAAQDFKANTNGLNKTMSFEHKINTMDFGQQYLNLPDKLPVGFYLVNCTWEDVTFQTFIQVTDLSYYFVNASNKDLFWVNDISTGKPAVTTITDLKTNAYYQTNDKGLVEIPASQDEDYFRVYKLTNSSKTAVAILNSYSYGMNYGNSQNQYNYWRYLQTDRSLYQPDGSIELWGFLQNRYKDENIKEITVELTSGYWYYWDYLMPNQKGNMPFVTKTLSVENGFYTGKLEIPNLEEGGYQLNIKLGDKTISSIYIQIQKYKKPDYKIEISKDKKAIFAGESVAFTAKTSFFEGTPVSNLDVNYNFSMIDYKEGSTKTDTNGNAKITFTPSYKSGYQGEYYAYFSAYASLPESGEIYGNDYVRVFLNDINVKIESTLEDNKGTLSAVVNKIDLTKINNSSEEDAFDYLGEPVNGQVISGTIYKNEWKKREIGQHYDYINKVVVKDYEYYTEKTVYKDVTLTTNAEGKATLDITFDTTKGCYYTVELTTADSKGRGMNFTNYFGEKWMYYYPSNYDNYILEADKETYDVNETVTVEFTKNEEPMGNGAYLYTVSQNGIMHYEIGTSSTYKTNFKAEYVPNVEINGIYFNGNTYITALPADVRLNTENNRLELTATTDKEAYRPGEKVTVTLEAKIFSKADNAYVGAKDVLVNISLVDEALLKLSENYVETLASLYEWVPSGIIYSYASHRNDQGNNGILYVARGGGFNTTADAEAAIVEEAPMNGSKSSDNGVSVRSDFKDTAYFATVKLDENGKGTITFKLPDNVTSWRMTLAGISTSLMAGSKEQSVIVTLPYFINASLNDTYLVGDKPYVGVTGYGTSLKQDEVITYKVYCKEQNYSYEVTGKAFERVNIPLFTLTEGTHKIIIESKTASGLADAVEKEITVVKTYHQKLVSDYYTLTSGLKITTNNTGNTEITFVDQGKGKFLPELYSLAYSWGKRVDQRIPAELAAALLVEAYGKDVDVDDKVELTDFQNDDGGFGILPYADSDLETTIMLLPLIKDDVNTVLVKMYLQTALDEGKGSQAMILYGLALLGEPVILQLDALEKVSSNLSLKDLMYLSLAYAASNDNYKAKEIYDNSVLPLVEKYDQVARIKSAKNEDSYLEYTAIAMLIASKLDLPEKDLFFEYVRTTYSKELITNAQEIAFIKDEIGKLNSQTVTVTYKYDQKSYTKKVENGWPVSITIPSSKLKDFEITSVTGTGALVATYKDEFVASANTSSEFSATRRYIDYYTGKEKTTFNQNDIVKVEIDWNVSKNAIDDYYTITDYVPSGLVPIQNTWGMGLKSDGYYSYKDIDEQTVTFYVSKYDKDQETLFYYARVVSPGTYNADGLSMQGVNVLDSMYFGNVSTIKINE